MAADWFRDPAWDEEGRAEFERKLGRSRPGSRSQYLRIKGLAVEEGGDLDGAESLFRRVLDEAPDSLDAPAAREHLGDLARSCGRSEEAEAHYRELIAEHPTLKATTGLAELSLAELLIERDARTFANEASELLEAVARRRSALVFNSSQFRWLVARTRVAAAQGDLTTQVESASAALELLGAGPPFSRHPTVGLAEADPETRDWLVAACDSQV